MRKVYKLIITLFICIFLTGCFGSHIEDLNGETDYSLSTLTQNDLIGGTKTSIIAGNLTTSTNNKFKQKVKKMSGVSQLFELDSNDTYTIEFNVTSGNGLVGIICDDEIIEVVEANSKITITVPSKKDYEVKIAGESCEFEILITKQ